MYGKVGHTAFMAAPAGTLAVGGLDVLWWAVAISTLVAATLALLRLLPLPRSARSRHHTSRERRSGHHTSRQCH